MFEIHCKHLSSVKKFRSQTSCTRYSSFYSRPLFSFPGVFFITKTDGSVDVWDLLDRYGSNIKFSTPLTEGNMKMLEEN